MTNVPFDGKDPVQESTGCDIWILLKQYFPPSSAEGLAEWTFKLGCNDPDLRVLVAR